MKRMMIAFFMNLLFSLLELAGGFLTGSVAIASDAVHDLGDAVTIGIACFLEQKSNRQPNGIYTYGYRRYSVLAGFFATLVLLAGSLAVIYHAVGRILTPVSLHYDSMIYFSMAGVLCNGIAAYVTHRGDSVNQKAVNLHMLEDVLGWIAVLLGAIVMKLTGLWWIDPLLSVLVALFVIVNAFKNLKRSLEILLEKAPAGISVEQVKELVLSTKGIQEVHHIHLWSMDGVTNYATMHLVTRENHCQIKETVKQKLHLHGISHVTLELEEPGFVCHETTCAINSPNTCVHHHH